MKGFGFNRRVNKVSVSNIDLNDDENYIAVIPAVMYVYDRCAVQVKCKDTTCDEVSLTINYASYISGDAYTETRTLFDDEGDGTYTYATFDISAVLKQLYRPTLARLAGIIPQSEINVADKYHQCYWWKKGYKYNSMDYTLFPIESIDIKFYNATEEYQSFTINSPFMVIGGSNAYAEDEFAERTHLINTNYPCLFEFCCYDGENFADTTNKYDIQVTTAGTTKTKSLKLPNNRQSLFFCQQGAGVILGTAETGNMVSVKIPKHLSIAGLANQSVSLGSWEHPAMGTTERVINYIVDNRTKGLPLYFLDRFGHPQLLVLDIASDEVTTSESTYSNFDGENIVLNESVGSSMNGVVNGAYYLEKGNAVQSVKEMQRVIHCGMNACPKSIIDDVIDLSNSPIVGAFLGFDVATIVLIMELQQVRVSVGKITDNEKTDTFSFDCDVYIKAQKGK